MWVNVGPAAMYVSVAARSLLVFYDARKSYVSEIGDVGDNEWDRNGSTTCLQELEDNASINALGEAADCAHKRQQRRKRLTNLRIMEKIR